MFVVHVIDIVTHTSYLSVVLLLLFSNLAKSSHRALQWLTPRTSIIGPCIPRSNLPIFTIARHIRSPDSNHSIELIAPSLNAKDHSGM
ncbi:hypothetical protein K432DRAFT_376790 [Lepidopterella palustris CBS 459.81]|uniref:Uncharacterized protein n=1 Tax=Lepidopterella palustris CBS 459.81 TaxID=1314670 RepID=A0A8E2EM15_9PEZI|nr:hypothetical protein K432DRAFT_376790 [Lepidopterella palustris CBS 459.81]